MDSELEKSTNVIFIGGTGRCGTNVTKEILSEHPQIASLPFETRFTLDPHGIIDCYNTLKFCWSPYIAHNKIQELEHLLLSMQDLNSMPNFPTKLLKETVETISFPYAGWELEEWFPNYQRHVNDLLKNLKQLSYKGSWPGEKLFKSDNKMCFTPYKAKVEQIFQSFLQALINDFLLKRDKKVFVDDNTWNMLFAVELKTILPEAKFIHLVRDPKDVIVSFTHQRWAPNTLDIAIKFYESLMEKIIDVCGLMPPESILQVKLEDLVSNPDKIMETICAFSGIEPFANPVHKDLTHSHNGRWKHELAKNDQKKLARLTKRFSDHFSYFS